MEGHINLAIIAYDVVHEIRTKRRQHPIHDAWESIQKELNSWKRTMVMLSKNRTKRIALWVDDEPEDLSRHIRDHMGLDKSNHLVKRVVKLRSTTSMGPKGFCPTLLFVF